MWRRWFDSPLSWPQLLLMMMALSPIHTHEVAKKSDAPRAEERMLELAKDGLRSIELSLNRLLKMVESDNVTTVPSGLPPSTFSYPTLSPSFPPSPTHNHSRLTPKPVLPSTPEPSHTPYFTQFSGDAHHTTTQHPTHTFPRPSSATPQTHTPSHITPAPSPPPSLPAVLSDASRAVIDASRPVADASTPLVNTSHLAIDAPHPGVNASEVVIDTLHSALDAPRSTAPNSDASQPPTDTLTSPVDSYPKAPNTGANDPVIDTLHGVANADTTAPTAHSHHAAGQPSATEEEADTSAHIPPPHSHIPGDNPRESPVAPRIPPEGRDGADVRMQGRLPTLSRAEDAGPTFSAPGETLAKDLTAKSERSQSREDGGGGDDVPAEAGTNARTGGAVSAGTSLSPGEEKDLESTGSAGEEETADTSSKGVNEDNSPMQGGTKIPTSEDSARAVEVASDGVNEDETIPAGEENTRHSGAATYQMATTPEGEENEPSEEIPADGNEEELGNEDDKGSAEYKTAGVEGEKVPEENVDDFADNGEEKSGLRLKTHSSGRKIRPGDATNEENGHSIGHQTNHARLYEDKSGLPRTEEDNSGTEKTGEHGRPLIEDNNEQAYKSDAELGNESAGNEKTSGKKKMDEDEETRGEQDGAAAEERNDNGEVKGGRTAEDSGDRGARRVTEENNGEVEGGETDAPNPGRTTDAGTEENGETENGKEYTPNQGDRPKADGSKETEDNEATPTSVHGERNVDGVESGKSGWNRDRLGGREENTPTHAKTDNEEMPTSGHGNEDRRESDNSGWNEKTLGGGEENNAPINVKTKYPRDSSPTRHRERRSAEGGVRSTRHVTPPPPHVHPHPCTPHTPLSKRVLCGRLSAALLAAENATEELLGGRVTETGAEELRLRAEELKEVVGEVAEEEEVDPLFTSSLDKVGLTSDLHTLLKTVGQVQDKVAAKLLAVRGMGLALVVTLVLVGMLLLLALCSAVALVAAVRRRQVRREELYRKVSAEQIPVRSFLESGHENQAFREEEESRPSARSIPRLRPRQDSCQSYNLTREEHSPKGGSPLGQKFTSCTVTQPKPGRFSPDRHNHNAKRLHHTEP